VLFGLAPEVKVWPQASYARTREATRALVKRAISGDIDDLDSIDALRTLSGIASVATSPDWQQSATRLVDILIRRPSHPIEAALLPRTLALAQRRRPTAALSGTERRSDHILSLGPQGPQVSLDTPGKRA
jgi:hypothetical protein